MRRIRANKAFSLLLTLVMFVGMLPVSAFADNNGHSHSEDCYADVEELICNISESEGHAHRESCYCAGGELICTAADETHVHDENCYCPGGELICTIAESMSHTHGADCYAVRRILTCGLEETKTDPMTEGETETNFAVLGRDILSFESANPVAELEIAVGDDLSDIGLPQSIRAVVGFEDGEVLFTPATAPQPLPEGYTLLIGATLYETAIGSRMEYRVYGTVNDAIGWFACDQNGTVIGMVKELPLSWNTDAVDMTTAGSHTITASVSGYTLQCAAPTLSLVASEMLPMGRALLNAEEEEPTTIDITVKLQPGNDITATYIASNSPSVTYYLYRKIASETSYTRISGGTSAYRRYCNSANSWTNIWQNQPRFDNNGNEYMYAVYRYAPTIVPTPYLSDINGWYIYDSINDVFTEIWTIPETTNVTATITWQDGDNHNGVRPENIDSIFLNYGDGSDFRTGTITANSDGTYTAVWANVPTMYNGALASYSFTQPGLPGNYELLSPLTPSYSAEGYRYTLTNRLKAIQMNASLYFPGTIRDSYLAYDNASIPSSVTATLFAGNKEIDSYTFAKTLSNGWNPGITSYTFFIPTHDSDGTPIALPTGDVRIEWSDEFTADGHYETSESTNAAQSQLRVIYPYVSMNTGTISWLDNGNDSGIRPKNAKAVLLKNGIAVEGESVVLPVAGGSVTYGWTYLPMLDANGDVIEWSVGTADVPCYYSVSITETDASDVITSTQHYHTGKENISLALNSQSMTATVLWEGSEIGTDNELRVRPDNLNLKLFYTADNGATWHPFGATSEYSIAQSIERDEWTLTWNSLPATDSLGNPIRFKAVQQDVLAVYQTTEDTPVYITDFDGDVTETTQTIHNVYNDSWNYVVRLEWNRTAPTEKYTIEGNGLSPAQQIAQYLLHISVQKDYAAGMLQVEIPYELFDARSGNNGTVLSDVSLGDETNPSSMYSFTYRIDDKGTADTSDDVVVFYNYKPISSGDNFIITAQYKFFNRDVIDCSIGTLTANAVGQYQGQATAEAQQTQPITYRVDTGVYDRGTTTKTFAECLYYWPSEYGEQPENFDITQYNYVRYIISNSTIYSTQPFIVTIEERPEDGGKVIYIGGNNPTYFEDGSAQSTITSTTYSNNTESYNRVGISNVNVIVRYPRIAYPVPELQGQYTYETDYLNTATRTITCTDVHPDDKGENDFYDIASAQATANAHWQDYVFSYSGNVYSTSKTFNDFPTSSLTSLEYGIDVSNSGSISMTVNGYDFPDGYSIELKDDALYARAQFADGTYSDYIRLTEDDYEFTGTPSITIVSTMTDRTNGQMLEGLVPADPFVLWGRKGNTGLWQRLAEITMTQASSKTYSTSVNLTGQGYTALRVTSPEGLLDYFKVFLNYRVALKGGSPLFEEWIDDEKEVTSVTITNFAAYNMYAQNGTGEYQWINPHASFNSLADTVGLLASDTAEFGDYQERRNASRTIVPAAMTSSCSKTALLSNNVVDETITARYVLAEFEQVNTTLLPAEFYQAKSQDSGVFYDLLPMGFYYDAHTGVAAYSRISTVSYNLTSVNTITKPSGSTEASVESVTTIDDWRGTGRQMVIIRVASLSLEGENWYTSGSNMRTGFLVSFCAKAIYDDVTSGQTVNNIAAFQRGDDGEIWNGYTERGYGGQTSSAIFINGADGQRALYDLDNDGNIEENNTLYMFASQSASYIKTVQNGITKLVKADAGIYLTDDTVGLTNDYSYRLSLTTDKNGFTKNVVLYDILENAANTGGVVDGEDGWCGTFRGVNTLSARNMGIDVRVWYATAANLSYNDWTVNGYVPEGDPTVWSTTPPADLSAVTAVAFDLRKDLEGNDKVFDDDVTVNVEIKMTAPSNKQASVYAYNRPAYNSSFRPKGVEEFTTTLIIGSRTTLRLADLQDIVFIKQYLNDGGVAAPLGGITFKLYQCTNTDATHTHSGTPGNASSCWGSTAIATTNSTSQGVVRFSELDSGIYAVYETSTRTGFQQPNYRYWIFTVDADNGTVSDPVPARSSTSSSYPIIEMQQDEDDNWTLLNNRILRNISVKKNWTDGNSMLLRPETLSFDLYRNGVLYRTETVTVYTGTNRTYTSLFNNLPVYDLSGTYYVYKVVERPIPGYVANAYEVTLSNTTSAVTATFTNVRQGVLDIEKLVEGTTEQTSFPICVVLTNASGAPVTGSFTLRRYASATATAYTEETVTASETGVISLNISANELLRLMDIPLGASYAVTEGEGDYITEFSSNAIGSVSGTSIPKVTVTNKFSGDLTVTKTVEGNAGIFSQKFTFTVTLKDANGNPVSGTFGGKTFDANGQCSFKLAHNESLTITNIPAGTSYTVTETENESYTVSSTGEAGVIVAEETKTAAFTNTKNLDVDTGISLDSLPYILLLALAAGGAVSWIIIKRRKRIDR